MGSRRSARGPDAPYLRLLPARPTRVRITVSERPFAGSLLWVPIPNMLPERLLAMLFGRPRVRRTAMHPS
jgi:hypothetical protein